MDKDFNKMINIAKSMIIAYVIIAITVLGFIGWVIVKLLGHFGIL